VPGLPVPGVSGWFAETDQVDLIAGSRYLEDDAQIRAEVVDGRLQIIYLGVVLRQYGDWADYSESLRPTIR